jgi:nucleoside 2-deoxyribosyltransferase
MNVVYLAGPINGKTDAECNGWRSEAARRLNAAGLKILDPMARDYRGQEDDNVDEIVRGDLDDIESCDVVLVNACSPSWGTAMELVYAKGFGKVIVAFSDAPRISPWLRHHTHAVYSAIGEAVAGVVSGSAKGMR